MDRQDDSKRRLERFFHDIWSGRPRVQYSYEVRFTRHSFISYLSATFTRLTENLIVPKQLLERLQELSTERTESFHAASVLASIPGNGTSTALLVIAP